MRFPGLGGAMGGGAEANVEPAGGGSLGDTGTVSIASEDVCVESPSIDCSARQLVASPFTGDKDPLDGIYRSKEGSFGRIGRVSLS